MTHRMLAFAWLAFAMVAVRPSTAALPYARTVDDLCPALPGDCVVTRQWAVADGTIFDVGGRAFSLAPTARLVGADGASFSLVNTSQITLEKGSAISRIGRGRDAGTIVLQSAGACRFGGAIRANAILVTRHVGDRFYSRIEKVGGNGGTFQANCTGLRLDGGTIEAKGAAGRDDGFGSGGIVKVDAGGGALTMAKHTTVDVLGKGGDGGSIALSAMGACAISGRLRT